MAVKVYNLAIADADTEYSIELPPSTQSVHMRPRGDVTIRVAFEPGKVAGPTAPYLTFTQANPLSISFSSRKSPTNLYFAGTSGSQVVEAFASTEEG